MDTFETLTTGEIRVGSVPFQPGTQVEVIVMPRRISGPEFVNRWNQLCEQLRASPTTQSVDDDEILREIKAYRSGQ